MSDRAPDRPDGADAGPTADQDPDAPAIDGGRGDQTVDDELEEQTVDDHRDGGTDDTETTAAQRRARNRELLRRYVVDVLGNGEMDAVDEIFHEDFETKARPDEARIEGPAEMKEYMEKIRQRFGDLETEIDDLVASERKAMAKFTVTAVHEGDYFGVDPSNREVEFRVMSRAQVEDGKMIEQGDLVNPLRMQPETKRYARSTLLDQIEEGIVVVDGDDLVVEINDPAERLLSVGDREVMNDPVDALFEADVDLPSVGESTEMALGDDELILDVSATELRGPNAERLGRILTFRDVTDRVRRRQQLETLNRQNERLDQFVSVVSHDLRSPLKKASGYLEMARKDGDDEHFDQVAAAHDRVETIVEELLTVARSGMTAEETQPVSFSHLVEDAWATAGSDDATLETDLPVGAVVEADPNLLRHVLENLFRNAVEHGTGPGGSGGHPEVTVSVGTLSDREGFYVADDGPGIPESERDAVFEYGYTTDDDGTGFGLSIVEQFVEAHEWEVAAAESADGGARFEVTTGRSLDPR